VALVRRARAAPPLQCSMLRFLPLGPAFFDLMPRDRLYPRFGYIE